MSKCPGQDTRWLKAAFYRCPHCREEVEMFSDEFRRRCPHCGGIVEKDAVPNCASWCIAAKECLGEERYARFLEQSRIAEEKEARQVREETGNP